MEYEDRAMREGLHEESLALFDLLKKPDLSNSDIKQIKKVAVDLLETLKAEKLKIDHWRDKETTHDTVRITILDFLWSDKTCLPVNSYTKEEVETKAEGVSTCFPSSPQQSLRLSTQRPYERRARLWSSNWIFRPR